MDRTQYLLPVFVAGVMCAAQLGCGRDSSGEYRTFAEIESVDRGTDESAPADSAPASAEASASPAELTDTAQLPIEPELTPEPESDGRGDGLPADIPTRTSSASDDIKTAGHSQVAPVVQPSDILARPGETRQDFVEPVTGGVVDLSETPDEPRHIELLIPERKFPPPGSEGDLRLSYDDLNLLDILNMEPVPPNAEQYFPDWLANLEGRRIRIRGFMYPAFLNTGLRLFVLVRDNQECCFGPGAKIYDHIIVTMKDGHTTDYIQGRPFDVVGDFHIRPEADGDELYELYQIDNAIVIDK